METTTVSTVVPDHILGLEAAVSSNLFQPKSLEDTRDVTFQKFLIAFIQKNPDIDFVYRFDLSNVGKESAAWSLQGLKHLAKMSPDSVKGVFVAGSAALHYMDEYYHGNKVNWKSNDVDLFYLGCESNNRMQGPGCLDFVFCKEKTIHEVLLNFDLPCCRVGFDFKYSFYISAQALVALFTGKMYLPSYFSDGHEFVKKLQEYNFVDQGKSYYDGIHRMIVGRLNERIKKYQSRGFKSVYTHHDYVLPWVKNRFTYIDFSSEKSRFEQ